MPITWKLHLPLMIQACIQQISGSILLLADTTSYLASSTSRINMAGRVSHWE